MRGRVFDDAAESSCCRRASHRSVRAAASSARSIQAELKRTRKNPQLPQHEDALHPEHGFLHSISQYGSTPQRSRSSYLLAELACGRSLSPGGGGHADDHNDRMVMARIVVAGAVSEEDGSDGDGSDGDDSDGDDSTRIVMTRMVVAGAVSEEEAATQTCQCKTRFSASLSLRLGNHDVLMLPELSQTMMCWWCPY